MPDNNIAQALHEAHQRLADAIRQRDQLNVTIMQLESQVKALKTVLVRDTLINRQQEAQQAVVGLTEAIRTILRLSSGPQTAAQIKNTLTVMGFDFSRFNNPSAAVHNTLKRMVSTGELVYLGAMTYKLPDAFYSKLGYPNPTGTQKKVGIDTKPNAAYDSGMRGSEKPWVNVIKKK